MNGIQNIQTSETPHVMSLKELQAILFLSIPSGAHIETDSSEKAAPKTDSQALLDIIA